MARLRRLSGALPNSRRLDCPRRVLTLGPPTPGRAWIKVGRYWIAYRTKAPPLIVAVFYEMAAIPSRL